MRAMWLPCFLKAPPATGTRCCLSMPTCCRPPSPPMPRCSSWPWLCGCCQRPAQRCPVCGQHHAAGFHLRTLSTPGVVAVVTYGASQQAGRDHCRVWSADLPDHSAVAEHGTARSGDTAPRVKPNRCEATVTAPHSSIFLVGLPGFGQIHRRAAAGTSSVAGVCRYRPAH